MKPIVRLTITLVIALVMTILLTVLVSAQSPNPAGPVTLPEVSSVVTSLGEELIAPDGYMTVTFAPGAVHEPATVTLSFNVSQTIPVRFILVGSLFTIRMEPLGQLAEPVTVVIRYDPSVSNEDALTLVRYDSMAEKWHRLPTTVDVVRRVTMATTEQLGCFALVQVSVIKSLPPNAVIIDDQDASRFVRHGLPANWHLAYTTTTNYWNQYMYWTNNMTPGLTYTENSAEWIPALTPGFHQVYAFIPLDNATTHQARYQVAHDGQMTTSMIDQGIYGAEWIDLGGYIFGSEPGSNYILLDDLTNETSFTRIGFDAIGFVPNKVYLPLVLKNYPPLIAIKDRTGLHLGSRNTSERPQDIGWTIEMLQPIDGDKGGVWPTYIVVLSNKVYNLGRPSEATGDNPYCMIVNVDIFPKSEVVYDYIKRAAQAGVKVLIRINPSPGNFEDWDDPLQQDHHLLSAGGPVGGGYCDNNGHSEDVRHVGDIVQEIAQIHGFNARDNWHEYAFSTANEPNLEWYTTTPAVTTFPTIREPIAWQEMDAYFSKIYTQVQAISIPPDMTDKWGTGRLLTPPMAQERFAEGIDILDDQNPSGCNTTGSEVRLTDNSSGYENMLNTYLIANDGIAWHNYWRHGYEQLGGCKSFGDHLSSMVYPIRVRDAMRFGLGDNLNFILEADLASPYQMRGRSLLKDKSANIVSTMQSFQQFFDPAIEFASINLWLLSYEDIPEEFNAEIHWHEAYSTTTGFQSWFLPWWTGPEKQRGE